MIAVLCFFLSCYSMTFMLYISIYFDAVLVKQEWLGVFGCIHGHISKHAKQKQKLYEKLQHNYIFIVHDNLEEQIESTRPKTIQIR